MNEKYIKTDRLVLSSIKLADRGDVIAIFKNDIVKQTFMLPDFPTDKEAEALFMRLMTLSYTNDRYVFGVYLEGKLIGFMNDTEIDGTVVEMGYAFHPDYYNKGYASEAFKAVINYLFSHGFEEVTAGAFEENKASIRVMQKCGMILQNKTEDIDYRGKTHNCIFYSINKPQI